MIGYGPAIEAIFKFGVPVIMGVLILSRIVRAGKDRAKRKIAEQELRDRDEFDKRGEEWDGRGGLSGIVRRRLRRK